MAPVRERPYDPFNSHEVNLVMVQLNEPLDVGLVPLTPGDGLVAHKVLGGGDSGLDIGEQLRLVERVVHEVATTQAPSTKPNDLLGLFADDPELITQIGAEAIAQRQSRPWRSES